VLLVILVTYAMLKSLHLGLNLIPSMPIGFYWQLSNTHIKHGSIVAVCLPNKIAKQGLQRSYLVKGHCPSDAIPVLKEVIAVPGDTVKLTKKYIIVNSKKYWAPYQEFDHNGKPTIMFVKRGVYKHIQDYWLYGSNDPLKSWDSRYYGGVSRSSIKHRYQYL
jgi:conjugative transfer signal peptidase TraF